MTRFRVISLLISFTVMMSLNGKISNAQELGGYVGIGIRSESGENWQTYVLQPDTRFSGSLFLTNQVEARDYLLMCLLDYVQVECDWEGEQTDSLLISLEAGEEVNIPFSTPVIASGFHDFIILAFANPFSSDLTEAYRFNTDLNYLYSSRLVLLAEPYDLDMPTPTIDYTGETATSEVAFQGVVVNQNPSRDVLNGWTNYDTETSEPIDFFIHLGNNAVSPPEAMRVILLTFLNYSQVNIDHADDFETSALITDMGEGTQLSIAAAVDAPDEPGVYELMVVTVDNPYTLLEQPPFDEDRLANPISARISPSIRVAIVVDD